MTKDAKAAVLVIGSALMGYLSVVYGISKTMVRRIEYKQKRDEAIVKTMTIEYIRILLNRIERDDEDNLEDQIKIVLIHLDKL